MTDTERRCPLERKVLIQTMEEIVQLLSQDAKRRGECRVQAVQPKRCDAAISLARVTTGDTGAQAAPCEETAVVPYAGGGGTGGRPKQCRSVELRGGVLCPECRCLKRDGLQRSCRRRGCTDRCGFVRPAVRQPADLGSGVSGYSLTPVCCPGEKQAARLQYLHAKMDTLKRPPPTPQPPLAPLPPPPTPPYNWTGTFEHKCRGDSRCPRRRPPTQYPCGGARCRHWEVPRPCTLPVCRADCFEQPPGWPTFSR